MRVVFFGTPEFAVPSLEALVAAGYEVAAVVTQPDRPAGRGRTPVPPPVKQTALAHGIPVLQPESMRRAEAIEQVRGLAPDVIVVAAFGEILRKAVLDLPPLGCVNVHPSLLPCLRGPAPIAGAILAGLDVTGVTIMLIAPRMDAGPILAQRSEPIHLDDTTGTLGARLARMGAELLVEMLPRWAAGEIQPQPQDESRATYTRIIKKEDGWIDWSLSAEQIARQVRAYDPWPGTFTLLHGQLLKVLAARAAPDRPMAAPSTVLGLSPLPDGDALAIATGQGTLLVTRLQLAGRKPVSAAEFARGQRDLVGTVLVSEPRGA